MNFFAPVPAVMKIFVATGAFMVAMVVAMIFSALRYGRISPLLWFSGVMVVILGGLTIWLHKELDHQDEADLLLRARVRPAVVRPGNRPAIAPAGARQHLPGLDDEGWTKLTRNWAIFFAFMAVLNEAVWRNSSTDFWVGFKLWGALPLTFLFAAANIPMLLRHGLMKEDAVPAEPGPVE